jgi:hypothetical protein
MKFTLKRTRLNSGGYEYGRYGQYFGHGAPLYQAESEDGDTFFHLRATTRAAAKQIVKSLHAQATFFR